MRVELRTGAVRTWGRGDAVQLEPVFVPRPGAEAQDDGVLLVPTLADGDEGTVAGIVDAASMRSGALLRLPGIVPFGFHAVFRGRAAGAAQV